MNPELEARFNELVEVSTMLNPNTPDWYIKMCVSRYIREEEPHLITDEDLAELARDNEEEKKQEKGDTIVVEENEVEGD